MLILILVLAIRCLCPTHVRQGALADADTKHNYSTKVVSSSKKIKKNLDLHPACPTNAIGPSCAREMFVMPLNLMFVMPLNLMFVMPLNELAHLLPVGL